MVGRDRPQSKRKALEAELLRHGYVKTQESGGFEVYIDAVSYGHDIMCSKLDSGEPVFYVCRGHSKKLFPILSLKSALLISRIPKV